MPDRIDTPFTGEHFAEFCKKMLGQPYWYGTCLYRCTKDLARRKAAQYPAHYFAERNDQYYEDVKEMRVCADCVGAVKGYAWTNGGKGVLESIGTIDCRGEIFFYTVLTFRPSDAFVLPRAHSSACFCCPPGRMRPAM